ncbi:MAG TPA: hypothetical protein VMV69_29660 [Pirellulales bacterium]|nr:hypothetical protein [Pirellulales bacterium]
MFHPVLASPREKLGNDFGGAESIDQYLARIARRFSEPDSPFHKVVHKVLSRQLDGAKYQCLPHEKLIKVMAAYCRAPSFLARYLPLGDRAVRLAWEHGERRPEVIEPGLAALERAIIEHTDRSNQTFQQRVEQFLDFAVELAERGDYRSTDAENEDRYSPKSWSAAV